MEVIEMKYVKDVIRNDFENWLPRDTVFIESPTGTGKTTFILNEFLEYCYQNSFKIAYLVPRTILKEQIQNDLSTIAATKLWDWKGILRTITVETYQSVEKRNLEKMEADFIVCDEAHYFLFDSLYNFQTFKSFEAVLSSDATKIFISATLDEVRPIIENYGKGRFK